MGHFETGRWVDEPDMIEQLFGIKRGEKHEDPHTKAIKLIVEHINGSIAPCIQKLEDRIIQLEQKQK